MIVNSQSYMWRIIESSHRRFRLELTELRPVGSEPSPRLSRCFHRYRKCHLNALAQSRQFVRKWGLSRRAGGMVLTSAYSKYWKSGAPKLTPQIGASMAVVGAVHRIINGHDPSELGPPDAIHRIHSFTTNCFLIVPRWAYYCARAEFPCRYERLRHIGRRP